MELIKKHYSGLKNVLFIATAFFITFILSLKFGIVEKTNDPFAINLLKGINDLYGEFNIMDIFCAFAIYKLTRFVYEKSKFYDKFSLVFSLLLSLTYILMQSYSNYNTSGFLRENSVQSTIFILFFIGYFLLFYVCLNALLIVIDKKIPKKEENDRQFDFSAKKIFAISFVLIFLSWLFWIIMSYPGTVMPDSNDQLGQFFALRRLSDHHSTFSTYVMGICTATGDFLLDKEFGLFLYLFLQDIFCSLVLSFGVVQLYKFKIKPAYCFLITVFFALLPLWGAYAQWFEKDLLYSAFITLFSFYCINVLIKKEIIKKDLVILLIAGLISCLLRHNGLYAVAPALLLLIFYVNKKSKISLIFLLALIIALNYTIVGYIYPKVLNIKKGSVAEKMSIPFQQTTRYLINYPNDVSQKEKDAIKSVLDYDKITETYMPRISDPVKGTYHGNDKALMKYLVTWNRMFFNHPSVYTGAFINMSYGYLAPVETSFDAYISLNFKNEQPDCIKILGIEKNINKVYPEFLNQIRVFNVKSPILKYLTMPGFYSWIVFICIALLIRKKKYFSLAMFCPATINLLVCVASPLANSMRYALPLTMLTPFLIGWTYYLLTKE